jgi:hypothetical protein
MRHLSLALLLISVWLMSACSAPTALAPTASPEPPTATVTLPLSPTATATIATLTDTPAPSPTPLIPTETAAPAIELVQVLPSAALIPQGKVALLHPQAQDFVFVVDPSLWQVDQPPDAPYHFLKHTAFDGCRIDIMPPIDPEQPWRIYSFILGRRNWMIYDYRQYAFYWQQQMVLNLGNYQDSHCRSDQLAVLSGLLSWEEYGGAPTSTPIYQPTPRPTLPKFSCPGAQPPRLRIGDLAVVTADALWLRSAPDQDETKKLKLYYQYMPVSIEIQQGPVCANGYVYWKVKVTEVKAGGESSEGWLAESHGDEYYLQVWNLGW